MNLDAHALMMGNSPPKNAFQKSALKSSLRRGYETNEDLSLNESSTQFHSMAFSSNATQNNHFSAFQSPEFSKDYSFPSEKFIDFEDSRAQDIDVVDFGSIQNNSNGDLSKVYLENSVEKLPVPESTDRSYQLEYVKSSERHELEKS